MQDIKQNAPKGATHYVNVYEETIYCKIMKSQLYGYSVEHGWYKFYGNIPIKPL